MLLSRPLSRAPNDPSSAAASPRLDVRCKPMFGDGASLPDQAVVLRVSADPEPDDSIIAFDSERAVRCADPDGPKLPNLLEMERWVPRIGREKFELFARELLYRLGKLGQTSPEAFRGGMPQRSRVSPRR